MRTPNQRLNDALDTLGNLYATYRRWRAAAHSPASSLRAAVRAVNPRIRHIDMRKEPSA